MDKLDKLIDSELHRQKQSAEENLTPIAPSTPDSALLTELTSSDAELSATIPEEPHAFIRQLRKLMVAGAALRRGSSRVNIILGRYAAEAKLKPLLFQEHYKSYGDFFHQEILLPMGKEQATAYNWKRLAEQYAEQSIDRLQAIPITNLNTASAIAKGKTPEEKEEILSQAEALPPQEFKAWAESSRFSGPGELTYQKVIFEGNQAQVDEINSILGTRDFEEWAGTNNRIDMVLMALRAAVAEFGGAIPHAQIAHAISQFQQDGDREGLMNRVWAMVDSVIMAE